MEKWVVYNKKADFKGIGRQFGIDQVTARIIRNRDITEEADINLFLNGGLKDLYSPYLLKDADLLTDILVEKIKLQKPIRIIGDYDIDGVMSTYILKKALLRCGAVVSHQIPDRVIDGYGLNVNLIRKAYEDGIDTILTCDNGIAALDEIALAKDLGMTVLVTDHHEIPFTEENGVRTEKVSRADAVVNAHQQACPYPNKELCGASVAWKVICILYGKMQIPVSESLNFLENVAFATVGDVMKLTGENRILVKEGLKRIHHTGNVGMQALIRQCKLEPEQIDSYHFGFVLGPCINASGRLDTANRALELFMENDPDRAVVIANELVVLNEERKQMTEDGVEAAKAIYESEGYEKDSVIVIYLPQIHESIAGIVAGRIKEAYYKPTFILTNGSEGVKGSGRSIEAYSMYEELCSCSELLTKFGGHPMAAGLSLKAENVDALREALNRHSRLTEADMTPRIYIDVPMPVNYVTMDLVREFEILSPFGNGNPKPVFADRGLSVTRMWIMGKNQNVLRMSLMTPEGSVVSAICFREIDKFLDFMREKFGSDQVDAALAGRQNRITLSVIYAPKINVFRNVESLQFEIQRYC